MPTKSKRPELTLLPNQKKVLENIAQSRTAEKRTVERAQILLNYHAKLQIKDIAIKSGRYALNSL